MLKDNVVILYGGESAEREISCVTANAVAGAMDKLTIGYEKMELTGDWISQLKLLKPSFVFLALHGCPGEDGTVQAVLDFLNVPYNGSGVLASALAMDKPRAKKLVASAGVDVAKDAVYPEQGAPSTLVETSISMPLVVKPVNGGSSLGTSIVRTDDDWLPALERVKGHGEFMVEEYIPGMELSVGMMDETPLAVTEIIANSQGGFYDFDAKYADGGSTHVVPAQVEGYDAIMGQAVKVVQSIGCKGVSRVDFRYDPETNRCVFLEVNTLPGLTPTSLVPEQATYKGMDFNALILWMLEEARWQKRKTA
jgi:D-alanine-D-alanine ligase